ncbi:malto-oligosyltrehalose synthase [Mucilaginibacter panaciglaebae]|uniref:4-alpha-glucanotransferase n=1 Tax=Mucilaginibacter panaciglaebae TaxID=502331 RepID=A0ABP7WFE6_9SPHI
MFNPISTYRIQFHKDFTFKHLKEIIPYLHGLGIKTLYASPIFEATPGSMHGYDVVNPLNINPEVGTLDELRDISRSLKKLDINWLQDIVPNHMAYHPNNPWLMDVLEKGRNSTYASFFDIEWESEIYDGRIMVPFLGLPFDEAIDQKQIQLEKKDSKLWFIYFDQRYPVKVESLEKFTSAYIKKVNNDTRLLKDIAISQAYQLCHWQETDRQINFRRFFTVNGLICLNMQDEEVFKQYHQLIRQLLDEGVFQGLRVDHIDGLYDPQGYLKRLHELAGPETYITVEKILEAGEAFPQDWAVQGNTGYDFLAIANNLFTQPKSERIFTAQYQLLTDKKENIRRSTLEKKAYILKQHMAGELENLYQLFKGLNLADLKELENVDDQLKEAIAQVLIYCPVYRFYGNQLPLNNAEAKEIKALFDTVSKARAPINNALQLLREVLLERTKKGNTDYNQRALHFYQRCMQFTGPLMAKGVEDTLMYTFNRFIGHNEVGDSPILFGFLPDDFHRVMIDRQRTWPLSVNATSTHDTKRGEDVRARLNVLTDIPDEWFDQLKLWGMPPEIDKNDAYFIYQSLVGAHPMPQNNDGDFTQRLQEYLVKALREGKQSSDWAKPNEAYEEAVKKFIADLLNKKGKFTKSFAAFHQRVSDFGIVNSLSQVLLKFTCPGVPDMYQGCELWDLSLVDPDNRRPVDYRQRNTYLKHEQLYDESFWQQLWESRYNGQIKLCLTQRLLALRAADAEAFAQGDYLPLNITGKYKNNIIAFARQFGGNWYVIVVPLHPAAIGVDGAEPLAFDWEDTAVVLPEAAPRSWQNLLSTAKGYTVTDALTIKELIKGLPVALIKLEQSNDRGAGILMHITSLPSAFGAGDIGPQAYRFIDLLFESGQRYWQMLPVNPVDKGAGYSPYSASSSMAGNTMLISPELLVNDGWLNDDDVQVNLPSTHRAEFDKVVAVKAELFAKGYQRFTETVDVQDKFEQFKSSEAYWLDDFALYQVLKQINKNKPWYEWPQNLKKRDIAAIKKIKEQHAEAIDQEKWLQYVFNSQWRALKAYAKKKGVTLFGDMPFYISYDSVDVWANPEFFKLDKQGKITGIAGVPPDYFSAEGQLWGMPVYNWEVLKKDNYNWWLQRICKNLEYFDLIRLDHFRAFSSYWEVPGGERTAINGKWMPGPGADLFNKIKDELGRLPFVAEDLGDIDEAVYKLRDQFGLPGMKVLQFAFGNDMPQSDHIPHNYTANSFAYTGTHDNNTLKGWYTQDIMAQGRESINRYAGQKLSEKNICTVFARLCYGSVAGVAILPVQDVLELDGEHRMNMPASAEGNWTWRATENQLDKKLTKRLGELTLLYNR